MREWDRLSYQDLQSHVGINPVADKFQKCTCVCVHSGQDSKYDKGMIHDDGQVLRRTREQVSSEALSPLQECCNVI